MALRPRARGRRVYPGLAWMVVGGGGARGRRARVSRVLRGSGAHGAGGAGGGAGAGRGPGGAYGRGGRPVGGSGGANLDLPLASRRAREPVAGGWPRGKCPPRGGTLHGRVS